MLGEDWKPITSPTFGSSGNQLGHQLTYEVYFAAADLCESLQTLRPTQEQLLKAYERLTEEWTCRMGMWSLAAPLINFSTDKYPVQIGENVKLVALRHEDKTQLWNRAAFGPFGEPQVMDRAELARAQFMLCSSSTTERDAQGFGPEFGGEIMRTLTALRLLRAGDMSIPAILGVSGGLFEKIASKYVLDGRARKSGRIDMKASDWNGFEKIFRALGDMASVLEIPLTA